MNCKCGYEIKEEDLFCSRCGLKLRLFWLFWKLGDGRESTLACVQCLNKCNENSEKRINCSNNPQFIHSIDYDELKKAGGKASLVIKNTCVMDINISFNCLKSENLDLISENKVFKLKAGENYEIPFSIKPIEEVNGAAITAKYEIKNEDNNNYFTFELKVNKPAIIKIIRPDFCGKEINMLNPTGYNLEFRNEGGIEVTSNLKEELLVAIKNMQGEIKEIKAADFFDFDSKDETVSIGLNPPFKKIPFNFNIKNLKEEFKKEYVSTAENLWNFNADLILLHNGKNMCKTSVNWLFKYPAELKLEVAQEIVVTDAQPKNIALSISNEGYQELIIKNITFEFVDAYIKKYKIKYDFIFLIDKINEIFCSTDDKILYNVYMLVLKIIWHDFKQSAKELKRIKELKEQANKFSDFYIKFQEFFKEKRPTAEERKKWIRDEEHTIYLANGINNVVNDKFSKIIIVAFLFSLVDSKSKTTLEFGVINQICQIFSISDSELDLIIDDKLPSCSPIHVNEILNIKNLGETNFKLSYIKYDKIGKRLIENIENKINFSFAFNDSLLSKNIIFEEDSFSCDMKLKIISNSAQNASDHYGEYHKKMLLNLKKVSPCIKYLAVDFGTSNSCLACHAGDYPDVKLKEPASEDCVSIKFKNYDRRETFIGETEHSLSIVYFVSDSEQIVGNMAVLKQIENPGMVARSMKLLLGKRQDITFVDRSGQIKPFRKQSTDIIKIFLNNILAVAKSYLEKYIVKVILTHPVDFKYSQKNEIVKIMQDLGIGEIKWLEEPVAYICAYIQKYNTKIDNLLNQKNELYYLNIDFGGGTVDLALVKFEKVEDEKYNKKHSIIACNGRELGGDKIDRHIRRHLIKNMRGLDMIDESILNDKASNISEKHNSDILIKNLTRLRDAAENIKIAFSVQHRQQSFSIAEYNNNEVTLTVNLSKNDGSTREFKHTITLDEYNNILNAKLKETDELILNILEIGKISFDKIDAILLSGQTCKSKQIREYFEKKYVKENVPAKEFVIFDENLCKTGVSIGAAYYINSEVFESQVANMNKIKNSYGYKLRHDVFQPIIVRNSEIICEKGTKKSLIEHFFEYKYVENISSDEILNLKIEIGIFINKGPDNVDNPLEKVMISEKNKKNFFCAGRIIEKNIPEALIDYDKNKRRGSVRIYFRVNEYEFIEFYLKQGQNEISLSFELQPLPEKSIDDVY